jgi:hypothetical protein
MSIHIYIYICNEKYRVGSKGVVLEYTHLHVFTYIYAHVHTSTYAYIYMYIYIYHKMYLVGSKAVEVAGQNVIYLDINIYLYVYINNCTYAHI